MSNSKDREPFPAGYEINGFKLVSLLGKGGYGDVYRTKNREGDHMYAIKITLPGHGFIRELTCLNALQGSQYFPTIIASGKTATHQFIVMNLLGPSLSTMRRQMPNHRFSRETVLRLAVFMLQCLRQLHARGFVHCDVKPGNFLLNPNGDPPLILVDFGLSKRYVDPVRGSYLPEEPRPGFRGTQKYSSISAQNGDDQSRRDDLTSWLYSVVELAEGFLPWGKMDDPIQLRRCKSAISNSCLLRRLPCEFVQIAAYVRRLQFAANVNYCYLFGLLMRAVKRECPDPTVPFDWEGLSSEQISDITPVSRLPTGIECGAKLNAQMPDKLLDPAESPPCSKCCVA
jgi:serine/threonine protein kinase